ncbi:hypothetical protein AB4305_05560 [Nocardia sp. 2YAB30]|uniref:hypothetical protein n=1 Tax=unclassified Nocardia TaxID=2637762 RepID=UPI003F9879EC
MTWRILWDPDNMPPKGWLERADGSVAAVYEDGTVIDLDPPNDLEDEVHCHRDN